jgi:hypothetical protein
LPDRFPASRGQVGSRRRRQLAHAALARMVVCLPAAPRLYMAPVRRLKGQTNIHTKIDKIIVSLGSALGCPNGHRPMPLRAVAGLCMVRATQDQRRPSPQESRLPSTDQPSTPGLTTARITSATHHQVGHRTSHTPKRWLESTRSRPLTHHAALQNTPSPCRQAFGMAGTESLGLGGEDRVWHSADLPQAGSSVDWCGIPSTSPRATTRCHRASSASWGDSR